MNCQAASSTSSDPIAELTESLIAYQTARLPAKMRTHMRQRLQDFISGQCLLEIIHIPQAYAGRAIGQGGYVIERIFEKTGCSIQVGLNERLVLEYTPTFLLGTQQSIEAAIKILQQTLDSNNAVENMYGLNCEYKERITIPEHLLKEIIGEEERKFRYLQLKFQTTMEIVQKWLTQKACIFELIIYGEPNAVQGSVMLVNDLLEKADRNLPFEISSESTNERQTVGLPKNVVREEERDYGASFQETDRLHQSKVKELNEKITQLETALKRCQDENSMLTTLVDDLVNASEILHHEKEEITVLYKEKIAHETATQKLLTIQGSSQEGKQKSERFCEDKEKNLELEHRSIGMIQELIHSKIIQAAEFSQNVVLQNAINSYKQHIGSWIMSYVLEAANIPEFNNDKSTEDIFFEILQKFEDMGKIKKGLIVIGIAILGSVIGMTSWRFIFWAWPRLMAFTHTISQKSPIIVNVWVESLISMPGYKKFIETWSCEQPITKGNILLLGIDSLRFAIVHFAPSLFSEENLKTNNEI